MPTGHGITSALSGIAAPPPSSVASASASASASACARCPVVAGADPPTVVGGAAPALCQLSACVS
jgi:hypothetical protein